MNIKLLQSILNKICTTRWGKALILLVTLIGGGTAGSGITLLSTNPTEPVITEATDTFVIPEYLKDEKDLSPKGKRLLDTIIQHKSIINRDLTGNPTTVNEVYDQCKNPSQTFINNFSSNSKDWLDSLKTTGSKPEAVKINVMELMKISGYIQCLAK